MPKVIVQSLLEPAMRLREGVRIVCREASSDQLLARLATHELDVVLSDTPADPTLRIRAYSHLLGESGVMFATSRAAAAKYRRRFPQSLNGAPMFLPTDNTALRIYSTHTATSMRIPTLLQDPQYRLALAWQNTAYNQPPHASFFIGDGMGSPPRATIYQP